MSRKHGCLSKFHTLKNKGQWYKVYPTLQTETERSGWTVVEE